MTSNDYSVINRGAALAPSTCNLSHGALFAFAAISATKRRCNAPITNNRAQALHATPPSAYPPTVQYHQTVRRTRPFAAPIQNIRYSDFLKLVKQRRIEKVTFDTDGTQLIGQLQRPKPSWCTRWFKRSTSNVLQTPQRIRINQLPNDPELLTTLSKYSVDVSVSSMPKQTIKSVLSRFLFPLSLFASLFFFLRRSNPLRGNALSLARMKPTYNFYPQTNITFNDVAGCDGAKLELAEVVDFLKNPIAYTENGCIIPRGVLLYGPPGTGKTLLAKAVAGEACVPFVSISGSEFVELYVGVGASRVRELFFQAKKNAPCIVFLDEIDAVGRQRGAGYAGGNDEREQTINQILVEMDGFEGNVGVIILAATNRLDILDEAILRPGRFDRKVAVDLPDVGGRRRILSVHARGKPMESDVDLDAVDSRLFRGRAREPHERGSTQRCETWEDNNWLDRARWSTGSVDGWHGETWRYCIFEPRAKRVGSLS